MNNHKNSKNGKGRPTKLTPTLTKTICSYIADGSYIFTACAAVGIDERTYQRYIKQGEADLKAQKDTDFAVFVASIKKAEAKAGTHHVEIIHNSAEGGQLIKETVTTRKNGDEITERVYSAPNWQAAAWLLERKYPDDWGRRERHELTGTDDGKPITIKVIYENGSK